MSSIKFNYKIKSQEFHWIRYTVLEILTKKMAISSKHGALDELCKDSKSTKQNRCQAGNYVAKKIQKMH